MTNLLERLRLVESSVRNSYAEAVATNWYRNPDGPEAATEIERLRAENAALQSSYNHLATLHNAQAREESEHCKDCCCARSWAALGITAYTGRSIPEEIELIRAENAVLRELLREAKYTASRDLMAIGHARDSAERKQAMAFLQDWIARIDAAITPPGEKL